MLLLLLAVKSRQQKAYELTYPPGSSQTPSQMAHANVEMMFMILSNVMTQQKRPQYLTAAAQRTTNQLDQCLLLTSIVSYIPN